MARKALSARSWTNDLTSFKITRLNRRCGVASSGLSMLCADTQQLPYHGLDRSDSTIPQRRNTSSLTTSTLRTNFCPQRRGHERAVVTGTSTQGSRRHRHTTGDNPDLVRVLMRQVPHPVAIITATDPDTFETISSNYRSSPPKFAEAFKGATVSSFNTVTLTPKPIISFNIKRQSATFTALQKSERFNVHLLNETIEAEDIASLFASGNAAVPFEGVENGSNAYRQKRSDDGLAAFVYQPATIEHIQDEHTDNSSKISAPMAPAIQYHNDENQAAVAFRLECNYLPDKLVTIEDHVVVFGHVIQAVHDLDSGTSDSQTRSVETASGKPVDQTVRPCLTYVNGRYSRISQS